MTVVLYVVGGLCALLFLFVLLYGMDALYDRSPWWAFPLWWRRRRRQDREPGR